jgi:hypothetical protein
VEVRTKRVDVDPMFEKDQPQRILGIVVDRVEQASRFLSGALHVLQAQCEDTLDGVRASPDAASHDEHELKLLGGSDDGARVREHVDDLGIAGDAEDAVLVS